MNQETQEIIGLIRENYVSIGVTGAEGIVNCLVDLAQDKINPDDWGTTKATILTALGLLAIEITEQGQLEKVVGKK